MKIVINQKKYLKDFIKLNEEWIQKYFRIEQIDIDLAKNPYSIIQNNGYIFTILDNEKVLGACALIKQHNNHYELARMAILENYRGKGLGSFLIETCLKKLKDIKAKKVTLVSNTKLDKAIKLYQKYGFKTIFKGQHPIYKRANIKMELDIR